EPVARVLAVAFRRWTVEHGFRLGKQEAGLMDYEGRDYTGLIRHLVLALVVLGFVATHTERLRGEKPAGGGGARVPGAQPGAGGGGLRRSATPVRSFATTSGGTRRPGSLTRKGGVDVSSKAALYC